MSEAEDRDLPASQRRLDQARAEGRVPLSREVATVAVLAAGVMVLSVGGPGVARTLIGGLAPFLEDAHRMGALAGARSAALVGLAMLAPFALAIVLAGGAAVLLQTGMHMNTKAFTPDFSRISPMTGFGRIFGTTTLAEAGKSLLKITVVGYAGWIGARGLRPLLAAAGSRPASQLGPEILHLLGLVLLPMLGAQGVIALFDVARARLKHARDLRMTREEAKQEHRESEGDPHVKGRIRQIRQQRARRQMAKAVRQATVVITNPTHYAVALVYDRARGGAPRIVAKGMDEMAARIRAIATANKVPLVANPPLARALYPCDLDAEIPANHFQAVAEIIAYVWRLSGKMR